MKIGWWFVVTLILAAALWASYAFGTSIGYEHGRWDCRHEQTKMLNVIDKRLETLETECRIIRRSY